MQHDSKTATDTRYSNRGKELKQKTVCSNADCLSNLLEPVTTAAQIAFQQQTCSFCGSQRIYQYQIVVNHGESCSQFAVVDASAPDSEQPCVLACFESRPEAQTFVDVLSAHNV